MEDFLSDFRLTIENGAEALLEIPEAQTEVVLPGGDWCAKQVLGHLIDSAANNHSRFVLAQLQDDLWFEGYDQEAWVRVQHYAEEDWISLVELWTEYNLHLLYVIGQIPTETLEKPRAKHTLDKIAWKIVPASEPVTLEYFIRDYVAHLKDHLAQISTGVSHL